MQIADEIRLREANVATIFLIIYYLVDEEYKKFGHLVARPGTKPNFSDSEVITIALMREMFSITENAWYGYIRKNHKDLFPKLVEQSRLHRRTKDLQHLVKFFQQRWAEQLGTLTEQFFILDSMPIPVCEYIRSGRNTRWSEDFEVDGANLYGYCASKDEHYFGFKLHLLIASNGVPAQYVLATSNEHDVVVAPDVLETVNIQGYIALDKGYVGLYKRLSNPNAHNLVIQARDNQKVQNTVEEKLCLRTFRKTVETVNSMLTEQFTIKRSRARSAFGLTARIALKIAALTIGMLINQITNSELLNIKSLIF